MTFGVRYDTRGREPFAQIYILFNSTAFISRQPSLHQQLSPLRQHHAWRIQLELVKKR
jgi:hypothetical protein